MVMTKNPEKKEVKNNFVGDTSQKYAIFVDDYCRYTAQKRLKWNLAEKSKRNTENKLCFLPELLIHVALTSRHKFTFTFILSVSSSLSSLSHIFIFISLLFLFWRYTPRNNNNKDIILYYILLMVEKGKVAVSLNKLQRAATTNFNICHLLHNLLKKLMENSIKKTVTIRLKLF